MNNAGITRDNLILRMSEADFDAVLDANLKGAFLCCKGSGPPDGAPALGPYHQSEQRRCPAGQCRPDELRRQQGGLIGLTKSLARELASRNVTVNAVAPGFIETDMTAALPEAVRTEMAKDIPAGRAGQPEDVANAVAFLPQNKAAISPGRCSVWTAAWQCKRRNSLWKNAES